MMAKRFLSLGALMAVALVVAPVSSQEPFKALVGNVTVGEVKQTDPLEVPFILWGGDVATFLANGGVTTKDGSIFSKSGLKINLKPGDDFVGQVKDYLEGKSPFLRGTMSMIAQASEVVSADPRTKPIVFLQMTWSQGDHLVERSGLKSIADLKGKKVAIQKGGPHVGMLHDILTTAGLKWTDITPVWTEGVTGPTGPAELMRKDEGISACFAITPDMIGLTGGIDDKGKEKVGTGADGTVKGARVLVSTTSMNRSIADVYACRSDFFQAHKDVVEKFAAGYLKGCEELVAIKEKGQDGKDAAAAKAYRDVLKMTMDIYNTGAEKGKEPIPTLEDAIGLIADAEFVFLSGNVHWFKGDKWQVNFQAKQKAGLEAAAAVGSVAKGVAVADAGWDFARLKTLGGLTKEIPADPNKLPGTKFDDKRIGDLIKPPETATPGFEGDANTIAFFTVSFDPNQSTFDEKKYGTAFEKAIQDAALFRNSIVAVRGHADVVLLLGDFVQASLNKGYITRQGVKGAYKYYLKKDGSELKLDDTAQIIKLIETWDFTGAKNEKGEPVDPKATLRGVDVLSNERAKTVQETVQEYARKYNLPLDKNQIRAVGIGVRELVAAVPRTEEAMGKNRRVEFRIYKVPVEATEGGGF